MRAEHSPSFWQTAMMSKLRQAATLLRILAALCFAAAVVLLIQNPVVPYHVGSDATVSCNTILTSPSVFDPEYSHHIAACNQERIRYLGRSVLLIAAGSLAIVGSAAAAWRVVYPPRG